VSEVAKRLRDRRLNVWNEARSIIEKGAEENRELTSEEQGTWQRMMEELDSIDGKLEGVLAAEKRSADTDAAFSAIGRRPSDKAGHPANSGGRDVNAEFRAFAKGEAGRTFTVAPEGPVNYRTLTTGGQGSTTNASGIVPTDFYDQLIAHLIEVSGVMQAGPTVLNTAGGEALQIPKTTAHSAQSGLTATQGAALPTADPAFTLATLNAYKYGILIQTARELIDDSGVDLLGYLAMQAGRAIGNRFGSDLVSGTGSTMPTGFMNGITAGVTGTTTGKGGAPQYADLVDLEYSIIAPYRQSRSCYWIAADKTIGGFRKIVDNNGRPVWEPSAVLGSPDLLLGKPLVADPFMPALVTGGTPVAFGDFSQYFVRLVGGVRFERSDDYQFGSDLVAFRAIIRGDGTLVDTTGCLKCYKAPTT